LGAHWSYELVYSDHFPAAVSVGNFDSVDWGDGFAGVAGSGGGKDDDCDGGSQCGHEERDFIHVTSLNL
jgi:hypothetical protein